MAVMGVNDDMLESRHRIVSNASSTVHAVTPVVKILNESFGIDRGIFTTIHSYTSEQRLADVPEPKNAQRRAAAENIIPQESARPGGRGVVLPELAGKLERLAMNVPVRNGSIVDLVCWYEKKVTPVAINEVVRTAAATDVDEDRRSTPTEPIVSRTSSATPTRARLRLAGNDGQGERSPRPLPGTTPVTATRTGRWS